MSRRDSDSVKVGDSFGYLTLLRQVGRRSWECRCICGLILHRPLSRLTASPRPSCGCMCIKTRSAARIIHGAGKTPEYKSWQHMKERCYLESCDDFKNYGGRGIIVCDQWRSDFVAFLSYVGQKPSPRHSIERIDTNGNYEPGNVRWATPDEQARNRRYCRRITYQGRTLTAKEWAREVGIHYQTVIHRLNRGITDPEQIFARPR